jgi:hypothetical protein
MSPERGMEAVTYLGKTSHMEDSRSPIHSRPQQLQLELMRLASRGRVADDLIEHAALWSGALMTSTNLVPLRDLERGSWNADTLYVLSSGQDDEALVTLAGRWEADSIDWIGGMEAAVKLGEYRTDQPVRRVLVVWWD